MMPAYERHGMIDSPEYSVWEGMKNRCLNPRNHAYNNYGGRGIKVCDRWVQSFADFYQDMGPRPAGYTIERIDNDGNYEPGNCEWIPADLQSRNTRRKGEAHFRAKYSTAQVKALLAEWKASGLSKRAFALQHEISPLTFSDWTLGKRDDL